MAYELNEDDLAAFLASKGKSLPQPTAATPSTPSTPKAKKPRKVAVEIQPPAPSPFQLGVTVKVKRPCSITTNLGQERKMPAGSTGKIVAVHTEYNPPCWFGVEFPPSADPFIISLYVNDLELA